MGRKTPASPNQLVLTLDDESEIERIVERRIAERLASDSFIWRFRLITVETMVMGALVLVAGFLLKQPTMLVLRASVLVAASCFATGLLLLVLSAWTVKASARFRKWRRR